jgi:multisubunit Na+/H+ antiporter MnhG subunit
MHDLAPVFALITSMIAAILIVRMAIESGKSKREAEAQLQLHTRLIDKFGSAKELLDYLQSDAGRKFLTPATVQKTMPYRRILAATQAGVVLTVVGVALWLIRGTFDQEGMRGATLLGGVTLALGVGFIASAILAHMLSRRWGLLNGNGTDASKDQ